MRRWASPRTRGRSTKASPTSATFLQQTYDIDRERQDMFFSALDRLRSGTLVCVFDATDRIQHMFWRYLDPKHPARAEGRPTATRTPSAISTGTTTRWSAACMQQLGKDDVLMVMSDHGFNSFRRGVNLNAWLRQRGLPRAQAGRRRARRVAARRRLVRDEGLLPRAHGHLPQPEGPGSAGHRRARRGGRRAESGDCERS